MQVTYTLAHRACQGKVLLRRLAELCLFLKLDGYLRQLRFQRRDHNFQLLAALKGPIHLQPIRVDSLFCTELVLQQREYLLLKRLLRLPTGHVRNRIHGIVHQGDHHRLQSIRGDVPFLLDARLLHFLAGFEFGRFEFPRLALFRDPVTAQGVHQSFLP